ncbi:MAG: hypothetical protein UR28_C0003G0021 [Candidatus Peregrinibacteria bacterium GW2011_GWF2_33_10]|nr:MAG: hypothetical protein UR28_C0003G0021 [Candidatus Peregrinibacteria bacterium GW2011_GWF2_33_10]OGJ44044.1 MAG: hypothetical protein A2272_01355 [Candidatus Peregrinibacteria bacterium RIFOXYA12_FULL_33_12]OGJ44174.1 MAG: hypothetical protein A2263_04325 [Candidatus Peregrinibacteria bacterium RIFOXYA2_FULL_33_21]OGJ51803.1 MAG: hypothetical protein A2307_04990 [Candidatus Peregrinibacteria bacterium RIFOXYB2_FULL_33_20]
MNRFWAGQNDIFLNIFYIIEFNKVYTYLKAGSKTEDFKNLGTYINIKNIEHSIKIGCKMLDANVGNY